MTNKMDQIKLLAADSAHKSFEGIGSQEEEKIGFSNENNNKRSKQDIYPSIFTPEAEYNNKQIFNNLSIQTNPLNYSKNSSAQILNEGR